MSSWLNSPLAVLLRPVVDRLSRDVAAAAATFPDKFSDVDLDDWITDASLVTNQPPALLFRATAASLLPPTIVATEDKAKENSDPNILLTVKRTLCFPNVPTGTRQKLGDICVHCAERPLRRGRNIVPCPPLKTAEDERPAAGTALAVGIIDSVVDLVISV